MPTRIASAVNVADYLLWRAREVGDLITNLKIQKLLYYAQAWYLVNTGERLFRDDIEAWEFGPVVKSAYRRYKRFEGNPIDSSRKKPAGLSARQEGFLDDFFRIFGSLSAAELVNMTHNERPWQRAYENETSKAIPPQELREYYAEQYRKKYGKKEKGG